MDNNNHLFNQKNQQLLGMKSLFPNKNMPRLEKYKKGIMPVSRFSHMNTNLQSKVDWQDFVYRYYADVDALKLYFIKVVPELIQNSESMKPGLIIDYDKDDKIVAIEIRSATRILSCDMIDYVNIKEIDPNAKPPMILRPCYYEKEDCFEVSFIPVENAHIKTIEQAQKKSPIYLCYDDQQQIIAMRFFEASKTIRKQVVDIFIFTQTKRRRTTNRKGFDLNIIQCSDICWS